MKFLYPTNYLVAIVFVKDQRPKKYRHNIKNTTWYIGKFCRDMKKKFPEAMYINFYYKASETFKERINLE